MKKLIIMLGVMTYMLASCAGNSNKNDHSHEDGTHEHGDEGHHHEGEEHIHEQEEFDVKDTTVTPTHDHSDHSHTH